MTHDEAVRNVRELAAQLDGRVYGAVATPAQLRYVANMAEQRFARLPCALGCACRFDDDERQIKWCDPHLELRNERDELRNERDRLARQQIGMLEKIGSLIEDRDKLLEAGDALHQRVMRADERIVALEAERDLEDRLLLADWHHSVKDGLHVWRTVLNLGVPGHWSDGSTPIEVVDADRATAARLAEAALDEDVSKHSQTCAHQITPL